VISSEPATEQTTDRAQRYATIFGGVMIGLTVIALIVAFLSSGISPRNSSAVPASWTRVYDADLTGAEGNAWDESNGCNGTALGLDANAADSSDDAVCVFDPSVTGGATAAGFYFETRVAPAANVPTLARALINVGALGDPTAPEGSLIHFSVDQNGAYTLCDSFCSQSSSAVYLHGGLASWHGNALLPNTIGIKVSADHTMLTVYVNGQQIAAVSVQFGPNPGISLGAASGDEEIYTHATLYTGH
jgi:hypothetical protein